MHRGLRRGLANIPVGVAFLAAGLLLSHTGRQFFGLSPDFSSGLLMGAGIGVLFLGLTLSVRSRTGVSDGRNVK